MEAAHLHTNHPNMSYCQDFGYCGHIKNGQTVLHGVLLWSLQGVLLRSLQKSVYGVHGLPEILTGAPMLSTKASNVPKGPPQRRLGTPTMPSKPEEPRWPPIAGRGR